MSTAGSRGRSGTAAIVCAIVAVVGFAGPMSANAEQAGLKTAKTKTSFKVECVICPPIRAGAERIGTILGFSGKVRSKSGKCVEGRTIKIFQVMGNVEVVDATSEQNGSWSTTTIGGNGEYRAVVTKEKRGNVVCKRAKSKPKALPDR